MQTGVYGLVCGCATLSNPIIAAARINRKGRSLIFSRIAQMPMREARHPRHQYPLTAQPAPASRRK
jgi:hypothetical protein